MLPKGKLIPVPLLCHVNIGQPVALQEGEGKASFLKRTSDALLALAVLHAPERQAAPTTSSGEKA